MTKNTKLINFIISHEFDAVLQHAWQTKNYLSKGINSKSDLWRYAIIEILERDNKGFLKKFKNIKEVKNYLLLQDQKVIIKSEPRIIKKVKRFFGYNLRKL